ncbi:hypothetical protein [Serratia proteamaculans]|uniref:hypothetical protein n=1 Tax=Serratia proteamaculans TaxID=28151 RepID=UPI002179D0F1|nr:hypothetical protein [Serratia proteamaculans]CAI1025676.1 Uncharacterised protein [Serratia proteamaculans]CAI1035907.1 Uncharacterised protein [Serratia proteamaculans]
MKNNLVNQDIKTDKSLVMSYEALKADRDAQQKRADALAVENASMFAAAGEVYAAGYNHGHLNTVDGIAYTDSVEVTFADRGAQVMAEFAYPPIDNKDHAQLEALIAENASLKSAITTHSQSTHFCELCGKDDPCSTDDVCYALNETPATDAALAAIEARFCGLLDTYGKVEPERFNPGFADLYAKIVNRIFSSVMDNPSVTDLESLTDYLESSAENSRAYADMSMKFHAELREAK